MIMNGKSHLKKAKQKIQSLIWNDTSETEGFLKNENNKYNHFGNIYFSAILGFVALRNDNDYMFGLYIVVTMVISFIILLVVKICPHCYTELYKVMSYINDEYNFFEFIYTDKHSL